MFAKNKEVQELYQSKWNELAKIREYTAVVEGITDNKGHIESYLKQTKTLLVYSSKSKDGYFAVTDYERIMYNNKYSMLKIHISTGRRNQIRCHMHDIKHPILGDSRYNSRYNPLGRLALHANKLVITNPISKKELTFVIKIPLEFYNLVKYLTLQVWSVFYSILDSISLTAFWTSRLSSLSSISSIMS